MDVYYGDGTADGISSIFFAFDQFKKDMSLAGRPQQGDAVRRAAVVRRLDR